MKFLGRELERHNPFIVAEISCNHNGDIDNAKRLMELAKTSGADAVKIQMYSPEEMVADKDYVIKNGPWADRNLYSLYIDASTPRAWLPAIFEHGKEIGIPVFSSVFGLDGLSALEAVDCPAYKIASFEASDIHFIRKVAKIGKPLVISVNALLDTTDISLLREFEANGLIILHCTSSYPTEFRHARLSQIDALYGMFKHVGYSDHNHTMKTGEFAAVLGAKMIERHITLGGDSEDRSFSLNPAQFKLYVHNIRRAALPMDPWYGSEKKESAEFERAVYATCSIGHGEKFTEENTGTFRPVPDGVKQVVRAGDYPKMLAWRASRVIVKGEIITFDMLRGYHTGDKQ